MSHSAIDYTETNSSIEEIGQFIEQNEKFCVMAHSHPDGDAYGSTLGLGLSLLAMGKDVTMVNQDGVIKRFKFMADSDQIEVTPAEPPEEDRKIITVDVPRPSMIGSTFASWDRPIDLNIDHHLGNPNSGKLNYVNPDATSAAELVFNILEKLDMPITKEVASSLYIGMTTDTGSFMFSTTTPEAFDIAAKLSRAGADTGQLSTDYFSGRSAEQFKLQMEVLNATKLDDNNRIAHVIIEKGMYDRTGATWDDKDNNLMEPIRSVETTEVTISVDDSRGYTTASLRSRGNVDVQVIAAEFGGGGHTLAAGIRTEMPAIELEEKLVGAVKKQLAALDNAKSGSQSLATMPEPQLAEATLSI